MFTILYDHLFLKNVNIKDLSSYVLCSSITDHISLILNNNIYDLNIQNTKASNDLNIKFKTIDLKHLNILIRIEDWNTLLNSKNVDSSVNIFNNKINNLIMASSNYYLHIKRRNNDKKCKLKP